jgi:hypothetical protein
MNTNKHEIKKIFNVHMRPFACPVGPANRTGVVNFLPIRYFDRFGKHTFSQTPELLNFERVEGFNMQGTKIRPLRLRRSRWWAGTKNKFINIS